MVRIGFIGAGGVARHHVTHLLEHPEVQITAVVDPDVENASRFAERTGARVFASTGEAIDHVDAAYVTTPPRVRIPIVRALAEAGRAIFCEKPLAATVTDALALTAIVEEHGVPFMMGFMRRWHPPYRHLKELADDGERLGTPLQLFRQRLGHLPPGPGNWRADADQLCGMTVESVSHDIDLFRWLGGEIVAARGEVLCSDPELPGFDDTLAATVRFASGATGSLQVSWASRIQRNQCGVLGTRSAAVVSGAGMWSSEVLDVAGAVTDLPREDAEDMGYGGETAAFLAMLAGGSDPVPGVRDGLRTVEISHEILGSSTAESR
jgi:myo-inositol 2-dehydrogenase/D-chiro-inositol 1-dehydrogenase